MKYIYIIALSASVLFVKAQGNLAVHVSAEETIVFGDSRSSFNFANLQNLSSNSGMRGGLHYTFNDQFSAEATLGVTGSSRPNTWYTKIVPVEIIGHYNVLTLLNDDSPYKFNADFGVGSALVSARSNNYSTGGAAGNFAFTENANLGASLDIPFKNLGLLTFGYRHTFFINDYVDATIIEGSGNDQMARFFTAIRVNLGQSAKTKTLLAEAEEKAVVMQNDWDELTRSSEVASINAAAQKAELENKLRQVELSLATANKDLEKKSKYILQSIHFDLNQSTIKKSDIAELTSLMNLLKANPKLHAEIIGHTDNSGAVEFNETLSLSRANAVKNWLTNQGISASRLTTMHQGLKSPMLPNDDNESRAVNRRTEIILK